MDVRNRHEFFSNSGARGKPPVSFAELADEVQQALDVSLGTVLAVYLAGVGLGWVLRARKAGNGQVLGRFTVQRHTSGYCKIERTTGFRCRVVGAAAPLAPLKGRERER